MLGTLTLVKRVCNGLMRNLTQRIYFSFFGVVIGLFVLTETKEVLSLRQQVFVHLLSNSLLPLNQTRGFVLV